MTDYIKLLPCPFCGGEAEMDTRQAYLALGTGRLGNRIAVYCRSCDADMGVCIEDVPDITPEQVAEMWNRRAAVEADRQQRGEASAADGMAILRAALSADPDYAWSWHCAVWAAAHDEGLETGAANRAAARLMRAAFDVDTTKSPNFNPAHLATEKEQQ